jgi:hypothetical protein
MAASIKRPFHTLTGTLPCQVARAALPLGRLGDAVLRRRAWAVADRLGWASTYNNAEYVALTQLQADAPCWGSGMSALPPL